jgi:hypothetical protein
MRHSRLMFCASGSLMLIAVCLSFVVASCGDHTAKPSGAKKVRTFPCGNKQNITVDLHKKNGVDHQAIYVCENDAVIWSKGAGVNSFVVHFIDCPLASGCATDITDDTPQAVLPSLPTDITVYKYTLSINGQPVSDPHVVGGGGA